jgi:recombination protein RecA
MGIDSGAVDKKGAWLQFDGDLIGQGKDAAKKALVEKPELAQKIVAAILAKRNPESAPAKPEKGEKADKSEK